jgi:hypothetical protein
MKKLEVSVRKQVSLECDCRCSKINFEVEDWSLEELGTDYTFSFTSDYLGGKVSRLRAAWRALTGRDVIYAEICTSREDAKKFLEDCLKVIDEG